MQNKFCGELSSFAGCWVGCRSLSHPHFVGEGVPTEMPESALSLRTSQLRSQLYTCPIADTRHAWYVSQDVSKSSSCALHAMVSVMRGTFRHSCVLLGQRCRQAVNCTAQLSLCEPATAVSCDTCVSGDVVAYRHRFRQSSSV